MYNAHQTTENFEQLIPYTIGFDNTNVYLINLERNPERLESFKEQYAQSDLSELAFTRVDAIDGKKLKLTTDIVTPQALDELKQINKTGFRTRHYMLTNGACGCFLSHLKVYEYISESNKDYGLIFEDDCIIDSNILQKLNMAISDIPNDWDMLVCACLCNVCEDGNSDKNSNFFEVQRFFLLHVYIVKKNSAKMLVDQLKGKPISQQIDSELSDMASRGEIKIYCLKENLGKQSPSFKTNIQTPVKVVPGISAYAPIVS
jgi:GR25 family glycosyltransferase involved in LPS biosynthesis